MNTILVYAAIRQAPNQHINAGWVDLETVATCPLTSLEIAIDIDEANPSFAKENPVLFVHSFEFKPTKEVPIKKDNDSFFSSSFNIYLN